MTDLSAADVLERAADLLSMPGAWTQGESARNRSGEQVPPDSDAAVCWCLDGAYERVGGQWGDRGWSALSKVIRSGPISWNDSPRRTQAQVVAKLREAASLARDTSNV
jgi:hypothetical protein